MKRKLTKGGKVKYREGKRMGGRGLGRELGKGNERYGIG